MAGTPEQARINGLKGGRPKGTKGSNTLQAEQGKKLLIQAYLDNIKPINEALVEKAKTGDIQAIKELHDRVYGKSPQPMDLKGEVEMSILRLDV